MIVINRRLSSPLPLPFLLPLLLLWSLGLVFTTERKEAWQPGLVCLTITFDSVMTTRSYAVLIKFSVVLIRFGVILTIRSCVALKSKSGRRLGGPICGQSLGYIIVLETLCNSSWTHAPASLLVVAPTGSIPKRVETLSVFHYTCCPCSPNNKYLGVCSLVWVASWGKRLKETPSGNKPHWLASFGLSWVNYRILIYVHLSYVHVICVYVYRNIWLKSSLIRCSNVTCLIYISWVTNAPG